MNIKETLERFAGLRVLVIGEAMLDGYIEGEVGRLCREAPVPVVGVSGRINTPGGAANAAMNVQSLGAQVSFVSVVGKDEAGACLIESLRAAGVDCDGIEQDETRRTLTKTRVVTGSQMLLRLDEGTTGQISRSSEERMVREVRRRWGESDLVIVSDYGYGVVTAGAREAVGRLQRAQPRALAVDSKTLPAYRNTGVTAVKPNFDEVRTMISGAPENGERAEWVAANGAEILRATGAQVAAVTLDTHGAVILERGRPAYRTYARPASQSRATGAGDTYISALGMALAAGGDTPAAAELASAAASIVVGCDGTTTCSLAQLREVLLRDDDRVVDLRRLATRVATLRQQGRRIVFTNGCFDILHRGHVTYLNRAKAMGDVLVVGLNSDGSVRRLKGPGRPLNSLEDRSQVLAALSCVDLIVPFEEDTPAEIIRAIQPDVFVKGGDYTPEMLSEAPIVREQGGEVHILPYVEDRSTTGLINRIRAEKDEGVARGHRKPVARRRKAPVRQA